MVSKVRFGLNPNSIEMVPAPSAPYAPFCPISSLKPTSPILRPVNAKPERLDPKNLETTTHHTLQTLDLNPGARPPALTTQSHPLIPKPSPQIPKPYTLDPKP